MTDGYLKQVIWQQLRNDELRMLFRGGSISVADDIKELGDTVVAQAHLIMAEATAFDDDEHQSGHFVFCSRHFRWSITRVARGKRALHLSL